MTRTLLYDGTCGLCARSVQFVLRNEGRDHSMRFATLEGDFADDLRRNHPELTNVDSVILVETNGASERILTRSTAVIAVLEYLGGIWKWIGRLARVVPRFVRDPIYDLVARTRYRVFGRDTACLLPTPEQRARFI